MYDVAAIGESLIDFTPAGTNELGMQLFSRNPGGAPANVLAMYAKLGGQTAFIGKVGDDAFGRFLTDTMKSAGIDVSEVRTDNEIPTTLAFVQLDENGDRSFSFYRKPGADVMLTREELPHDLLKSCKIFHFGSVSLTDEPCRSATLEAVKLAKQAGAIISYDPNYRPLLWKDKARAVKEMSDALVYADILKVSEEELTLLTGEHDLQAGAQKLVQSGASVVLITLGAKGAFYYTPSCHGILRTYDVKTVDTTGAGDAFLGALLWCLSGKSLAQLQTLEQSDWESIVAFANAAGSLTTTSKGAIPAMPDKQQIESCIKDIPLL